MVTERNWLVIYDPFERWTGRTIPEFFQGQEFVPSVLMVRWRGEWGRGKGTGFRPNQFFVEREWGGGGEERAGGEKAEPSQFFSRTGVCCQRFDDEMEGGMGGGKGTGVHPHRFDGDVGTRSGAGAGGGRFVHSRSVMTIDPRIPTTQGRVQVGLGGDGGRGGGRPNHLEVLQGHEFVPSVFIVGWRGGGEGGYTHFCLP